MRVMDVSPWSRSAIGFDRVFDMLQNSIQFQQSDKYPPYDIEKMGDDAYRIKLAVAGFSADELSVISKPNELTIEGRKAPDDHGEYLHRGIARRAFHRSFGLADYVRVDQASLTDGMLSIDLIREVPEAIKPRRIEIANSDRPMLERKEAA